MKALDGGKSCRAVADCTDHGEPLSLEQRARGVPKVGVVIDDEDRRAHALIVAEAKRKRIVASRNCAGRNSRATTERTLWIASFRSRTCARSLG